MPAHELESRVTERLLAFLKSDADVFDRLGAEDESPAISRNLVAAAKKLAARLPSLPSDDLRDLLGAFFRRVVIQENSIEVMLSRKELRLLLENGGKVIVSNLSSVRKPVERKRSDQFDDRSKEQTVWRRSSSGRAAQLQRLNPAS